MHYFGILRASRQAVFCSFLMIAALFAAPVVAQEKISSDIKVKEDQKTVEPVAADEADNGTTGLSPVEKNKPFDVAALTAKPSSDLSKTKNFRYEKTSFLDKTENTEQQQAPSDDTMMGVMGKGVDGIKLGGHVGFVVPIVARGNGVTTNFGDRFVFGFPVGLTLKTKKNIAIDFEFIPTFNTGRDFVLTIHPGIIYGFAKKYAVGVRAAYDAGAGSYGFTPLISRGFKVNDKVGFFIEADFPIRSNYRAYQDRFGSIAFAAHAGFSF